MAVQLPAAPASLSERNPDAPEPFGLGTRARTVQGPTCQTPLAHKGPFLGSDKEMVSQQRLGGAAISQQLRLQLHLSHAGGSLPAP